MQAAVVVRMSAGLVGAALLLACTAAAAQRAVHDWLGAYRMNHDGWSGQLTIADSKVDCLQPAWCRLRISYQDAEGRRHRARVLRLADSNQHLIFEVAFPNNPQRFDAHLFSHDRRNVFAWQYWSSMVIFGVVLVLVVCGIYFAALQFHRDLPARPRGPADAGGAGGAASSTVELSTGGLKVSSPVLGVVILVISLAFFYLYLAFVYPIREIF